MAGEDRASADQSFRAGGGQATADAGAVVGSGALQASGGPFMAVLEAMLRLHQAKQADYGGSYELAARLLGRPVVEVLLSRIADKLARACNLVQRPGQQGAVLDETLQDTLLDLANYAVLAVMALGRDNP